MSQLSTGHPLQLGDVVAALVADGLLPSEEAGRVRSLQGTTRIHPLILIANANVSHGNGSGDPLGIEELTRWLADRVGLDYYRIDPMAVDVGSVTDLVSQAYAKRYQILPVEVDAERVLMATSEPLDQSWRKDLAEILRREVEVVVANPLDVNRYLNEFYGVSRSVARATDAKLRADSEKVLNFEQLLEIGRSGKLTADDQHVVFIVDWLLQYAFEQRASDIHLEPRRDRSKVRFRIDGALHEVYQLPTPVMSAVISRIKILGRMDVAEKRRPQDGRIKTLMPDGQEVELRLSTMPTAFGEKCVMRIFDPQVVSLSFSDLGFTAAEVEVWKRMVERPHGIVLVTGPTGSGKTTTLYSTLRHLAQPHINVCTVEDPIEMVSEDFNQMQVQPSIGVDFASGVRTLLRQDPDIIMIGEIRDLETAQIAVQAALTGHLVLATLHTNDAPSAITRLLDLGVPHYLLRGTLAGVVAQRLVRTLHPSCAEDTATDLGAWEALTAGFKLKAPARTRLPGGCEHCRETGYRGRTAVYEMLLVDEVVGAEITPDFDQTRTTRLAIQRGMRPLRLAAAAKVARGITTLEEAARVVPQFQ